MLKWFIFCTDIFLSTKIVIYCLFYNTSLNIQLTTDEYGNQGGNTYIACFIHSHLLIQASASVHSLNIYTITFLMGKNGWFERLWQWKDFKIHCYTDYISCLIRANEKPTAVCITHLHLLFYEYSREVVPIAAEGKSAWVLKIVSENEKTKEFEILKLVNYSFVA